MKPRKFIRDVRTKEDIAELNILTAKRLGWTARKEEYGFFTLLDPKGNEMSLPAHPADENCWVWVHNYCTDIKRAFSLIEGIEIGFNILIQNAADEYALTEEGKAMVQNPYHITLSKGLKYRVEVYERTLPLAIVVAWNLLYEEMNGE